MVDFRDKKRFETTKSAIQVDPGLPEGKYLFQLTVVDDQGNRSQPAKLSLQIIRGPVVPDPRLVDPIIRQPITPIAPVTPIISPIR